MKPVSLEEFRNFTYLSNPTFSPNGKTLCYTAANAKPDGSGYSACIYMKKGSRITKLTNGGKEHSFRFLDDNTLLFQANREEDKTATGSHFYKISLNGGEAEKLFTLPISVSELLPLKNGDYLAVASTIPGYEDLYLGDKKRLAAFQKDQKDNEDYEEITQSPWWWNGATFTKGAYDSLFYYSVKTNKLRRLTELNESVSNVELSKDGGRVYFLRRPVTPYLKEIGTASLCSMAVTGGDRKQHLASTPALEIWGFSPADSFLLVLATDLHNGLNSDTDFYRLDYATDTLTLLCKHGESVYSSVGSDIRYGGGNTFKVDGDACYFISTRFDSAHLFCLEDGAIRQLTDKPGSVDSFDVCGGKLVLCALWDMQGQELYDGTGKPLTRVNAKVLRDKYVAQPEPLNVTVGDHEVHGFVLKPMGAAPGVKAPVIIDIHGGPKAVFGPVFYHEMQYWAGLGYYVIFCNPTGSDGRGDFMNINGRYGTVDYEDLMAFCDAALLAYPDMDASNFFETGGSYGGFMTNWIIGHTDRFKACASQRSISNWFSFYGVSDIGPDFTEDQQCATPWNNPAKLWEHSPLKYADKVKTPTLFIHSFEDYRCPIDQGYQMFNALLTHGVEAKMVCFRGENHELSRSGKPLHRIKRLQAITDWFQTHKG